MPFTTTDIHKRAALPKEGEKTEDVLSAAAFIGIDFTKNKEAAATKDKVNMPAGSGLLLMSGGVGGVVGERVEGREST